MRHLILLAVLASTVAPSVAFGDDERAKNPESLKPPGHWHDPERICSIKIRCGDVVSEGDGEDIDAARENAVANARAKADYIHSPFDEGQCRQLGKEGC